MLLYAPGNDDGLATMKRLLGGLSLEYRVPTSVDDDDDENQDEMQNNYNGYAKDCLRRDAIAPTIKATWTLMPMINDADLRSSHLGLKLEDALIRARKLMTKKRRTRGGGMENGIEQRASGGVVFLGMDSPVLSLDDIVQGLQDSSIPTHDQLTSTSVSPTLQQKLSAMLCPADDGGYGMLCVPPTADPSITFRDVYWSHRLTAVSQIKALTDQGIMVKIGQCMNDIDEPDDVHALCDRLSKVDEVSASLSLSSTSRTNSGSSSSTLIATKNLHRRSSCPAVESASTTKSREHFGSVSSHHPSCHHTRLALQRAGLL